MKSDEEAGKIQQYVYALQTRRDHSRFELQQKLLKRNFSETIIEKTLNELSAQKILNDERFTQNYLGYRARRGHGPKRIQMELKEKGIAFEIISDAFAMCNENWRDHVQLAWRKKFKTPPKTPQEQQKQIRFLIYRGFTHENFSHLFNTHFSVD